MAKKWHVIECFEGRDKDVYGRLAALGYEVWRPVIVVRSVARWQGKPLPEGKRMKTYAPIFGRYLFIRVEMNDSVFGAVIEQPGVACWLCWAGSNDPAIVPDELIEHYRNYRPESIEKPSGIKPGETVRALQGPFSGFAGIVNRVDSRGVLCVEISIFGRPTPVIFPVGHVELVEHGRRPPIERDVKQRTRKRA